MSVDVRAASPLRLAVAWQDPETRAYEPVGVLIQDSHGFRFSYLRRAADLPRFHPFLGFPDLAASYESPVLFPLFAQRIMGDRRPDRADYLATLDLTATADPWDVLARSEGTRWGDAVRVFPEPQQDADGFTTATFFVHGLRYRLREGGDEVAHAFARLDVGDDVSLRRDFGNATSPRAVLVTTSGVDLGWVPEVLADLAQHALDDPGHRVTVQRINGPEVPPNLRLLVRLHARLAADLGPFAGAPWARDLPAAAVTP